MLIDKELLDDVINASSGSNGLQGLLRPPADSPKEVQKQYHILLVDDVEIYREMGRVILKRLGHRVTLANNGEEAVTLASQQAFDMIFMDIQMPLLDGFGATARIRNDEELTRLRVPIIAMTCPSQGVREKCFAAGMDGYLSKPVQREDVVSTISRHFPQERRDGAELPSLLTPLTDGFERKASAAPTTVTTCNGAEVPAPESPRDSATALSFIPDSPPEQLPVFDRQGLMDLLYGEEELVKKFLNLYLASVGSYLDQLSAALFAGNVEQVHVLSHSMKGAAVNIGALRVCDAAHRLETLARAGKLEGAVGIFDTLMSAVVEFRGEAEGEIR
jgi:CheY-like chemotaxis protein/HPt (histidine-containing phosphotransfer) domain-containing protein